MCLITIFAQSSKKLPTVGIQILRRSFKAVCMNVSQDGWRYRLLYGVGLYFDK